jgi:hypothetical protein
MKRTYAQRMKDHDKMMAKLSPVLAGDYRAHHLAEGLRELAKKHGIKFREPLHIDTNGEFHLTVSNGTPHDGPNDGCGRYGTLAPILVKYRPRTGIYPTKHLSAEHDGWCMMNHFDVEKMLNENLIKKKAKKGEYYSDWDTDTQMYCVFHTDLKSGHAFASYSSPEEAKIDADNRNK